MLDSLKLTKITTLAFAARNLCIMVVNSSLVTSLFIIAEYAMHTLVLFTAASICNVN